MEKAGVIKMLISIPLTLATVRQLIIKTWGEGPRTPVPEKIIKNSKTFKKLENIAKI